MAIGTRPTPRELTVRIRVRTLLVVLLAAALIAAVVGSFRWATSTTPLQWGSYGTGPRAGLHAVPGTDNPLDTGPPLYAWAKNARFVYTVDFINNGRVPVTITGTPHTSGWEGIVSQPALGLSNEQFSDAYTAFHPVTIAAGSDRVIAVIFRGNPAACRDPGGGSAATVESVTLNYTVLSVFHDSQTFPIPPGDQLTMRGPSKGACLAAGLG